MLEFKRKSLSLANFLSLAGLEFRGKCWNNKADLLCEVNNFLETSSKFCLAETLYAKYLVYLHIRFVCVYDVSHSADQNAFPWNCWKRFTSKLFSYQNCVRYSKRQTSVAPRIFACLACFEVDHHSLDGKLGLLLHKLVHNQGQKLFQRTPTHNWTVNRLKFWFD